MMENNVQLEMIETPGKILNQQTANPDSCHGRTSKNDAKKFPTSIKLDERKLNGSKIYYETGFINIFN